MEIVSSKQKWIGFFDYGDDNDDYIQVEFYIEIKVEDNSFIGISIDEESKGFFNEPIKVKGFFEKNIISFILKYPYAYFLNDKGEIEVNKEEEYPDIHYYGELDATSNSYRGKWEITYFIEDFINGDLEEVHSGNWELKRKY